jgi:hypothetical protein
MGGCAAWGWLAVEHVSTYLHFSSGMAVRGTLWEEIG